MTDFILHAVLLLAAGFAGGVLLALLIPNRYGR